MVKMEDSVDDTTRHKYHKMYQAQEFCEVVHCSLYYFPDAWDEPIDD